MADRQVSIYVPPPARTHWTTTVLGEVRSAILAAGLEWCWATNYTAPWSADPTRDGVPDSFRISINGDSYGFFVKFRYRCDDSRAFEAAVDSVTKAKGWHTVFGDYDLTADLGKDRFVASEQLAVSASQSMWRQERADLLVQFLHRGLLLALDALVPEGPEWRFERDQEPENSTGSTFQSVVHLICNLTHARTHVVVQSAAGPRLVEVAF